MVSLMGPASLNISAQALNIRECVWLLLTAVIYLAWLGYFARRHSDDLSLAERLLATLIAVPCQILGTTLVLGSFNWLYWWPQFIFNLSIVIALAVIGITGKGGNSLRGEFLVLVGESWKLLRASSALIAIGAMALLVTVWAAYLGQLMPCFGWDSWWLHLTWAAYAHQNGSIAYQPDWGLPILKVFPWNSEIIMLWWILGTSTERWANICQIPFAVASALSCYLLARNAGARRVDSAIAGLLVFSIPVVANQMWTAYNHVMYMGLSLAALAFLSRKRLTPIALIIAGCAAGFMMGAKGIGIYPLIALVLLFLYRLLPLGLDALKDRRKVRLKAAIKAAVLFGGFAVIFGGYFYIRNLIHYGNPVGNIEVKVCNIVLLHGTEDYKQCVTPMVINGQVEPLFDSLKPKDWPVLIDGLFDPQLGFIYDQGIGGWGSVWTALLFPAIPIVFVLVLLRRRWMALAIMLSLIIPYFLFHASAIYLPYQIPVTGAGTTAFGYVLSILRNSGLRRALLAIACAFMLFTSFSANVGAHVHPDLIESFRKMPYRDRDRLNYFSSWSDPQFAEALESVELPGSTLAFSYHLPDDKNFAFWNATFTNRVVPVPWTATGDEWLLGLRASGAGAAYVGPDSDAMRFASSHPDIFVPLYQGKHGGIYKLVWN